MDLGTTFMLGDERIGDIPGVYLPPKGTGVTMAGKYAGRQFRVVDVWFHLDYDDDRQEGAYVYVEPV